MYRFLTTQEFWANFFHLPDSQKMATHRAWEMFKLDPFDARLHTHEIQRLSLHYGRSIYSVEIDTDLRMVFYVDGDQVVTVDIGTHDTYKW